VCVCVDPQRKIDKLNTGEWMQGRNLGGAGRGICPPLIFGYDGNFLHTQRTISINAMALQVCNNSLVLRTDIQS